MTHFKDSVPSSKPQEATGFKPESGQDNQRSQNTFQTFNENWVLYVSVNFRTTIISDSVTLHHAYCQCCEGMDRKKEVDERNNIVGSFAT